MKKYLFFILLGCTLALNAQPKLNFTYDNAGNQISRVLCLSCKAKPEKEIKEISAITETDLEKFSEEDVISYYPNPVKEELYLTWQLTQENYVSSIEVYSMMGQLLKRYEATSKLNNQNIPFQSYPTGVYAVLLNYSSGEQKSIKIIKQ